MVKGGPGSGKTALLHAAVDGIDPAQVMTVRGLRAERDIPWGALGRLCPPPADANDVATGPDGRAPDLLSAPPRPGDPLVAATQLIELWRGVAEKQGLLAVVVDDTHLLDEASAEVLSLAARRVRYGAIVVLISVPARSRLAAPDPRWEGLEVLALSHLTPAEAGELLVRRAGRAVHPDVVARLVCLTGGNPMGLVDAAYGLGEGVLSGALPIPEPLPVSETLVSSFGDAMAGLDEVTRTAMAVLALTGDDAIRLKGALAALGTGVEVLDPVIERGLVTDVGVTPSFSHPLLAAVAFRSVTPVTRRTALQAVAGADPDPLLSDESPVAHVPVNVPVNGSVRSAPVVITPVDGCLGDDAPDGPFEVTVLGGFAVRQGDTDCTPRGMPAQLVKNLAVHGSAPVDVVVEDLWPDCAPGVGRVRLRNVLSRARTMCGGLVVRNDEVLCFAEGVVTDMHVVQERIAAVMAAAAEDDPDAFELAKKVVDLYGGELLPADRYAAWTAAPRERLTRNYLTVAEMLVEHRVGMGRPVEAVHLLERMAEMDRYEDAYYVRAADLLVDEGAPARAAALLRRARQVTSELGLPTSPAVDAVEARLTV